MADAFLFLHIVAGVTSLLAAGAALGCAKGGAWHRRAGLAYVLAMLVVTLTTFALVLVRPNLFLFVIAIFSFYLVFTGWRAGAGRDGRPRWPDHLAGAAMALTGAAMLAVGALRLFWPGGAEPVILLVFGSIGLTLALSDWRDWRRGPITGTARIARHLTRMVAGSIVTITAAVVVNLSALPPLVVWLGPTVLITPLIVWWNARILRPAQPF
ncbi:MAG: hypothetical protein ACK4GT_01660 [Pararhodobacter sp.]